MIDHWSTKYTRRLQSLSGLWSGGLSSSHPTPKDPLFADVFVPDGNTEPIDCWLLSVSEPRTFTSLSLPRDMAKITARHAACEATFGSTDPFRSRNSTDPVGKNAVTLDQPAFPSVVPYGPNLRVYPLSYSLSSSRPVTGEGHELL